MLQGYEQRFATGETIIHQGAQGDRLFIIKLGTVMICRESAESGDLLRIAELGPGHMFGEMYLLSHEHTRNATAIAASEVTAYVVFEDSVAQDFQKMSPFQKIMFREMGRRVNDMNESYLGRSAVWSGTAASAFSSPQAPDDAEESIQWRDATISSS